VLDPRLGVVLALWLAAYMLAGWKLLPPLRQAGQRRANERSVLNGRLVDAFTNIMAGKLFDSGRREHAVVREGMARYVDAVAKLTRAIPSVRGAVALSNGVMMAAVLVLAIGRWMAGDTTTGEI